MHVIYDVNLVEENARVEHVERRIVDSAREYDVLEKLKAVGMVYLPLNAVVADRYRLMVAGGLVEELAVIGLVSGEFWVVCGM